jgi:hypothetical protein
MEHNNRAPNFNDDLTNYALKVVGRFGYKDIPDTTSSALNEM